jgi:hypothetical protein
VAKPALALREFELIGDYILVFKPPPSFFALVREFWDFKFLWHSVFFASAQRAACLFAARQRQ